jgi:hypothetical protein
MIVIWILLVNAGVHKKEMMEVLDKSQLLTSLDIGKQKNM